MANVYVSNDNGETATVDKIKHHEKHNQAKNLNRQLMTKISYVDYTSM